MLYAGHATAPLSYFEAAYATLITLRRHAIFMLLLRHFAIIHCHAAAIFRHAFALPLGCHIELMLL